MTAERLRDAATTLREQAKVATPGPWEADRRGGVTGLFGGMVEVISDSTDQDHADYIATMHPGVALALADWLDKEATFEGFTPREAIAVADAVLGGDER